MGQGGEVGGEEGITCCFSSLKYGEYNGQELLPYYSGPDGYPDPSNYAANEPFTIQEIRLMRQVSGFGFRIIGGKEEGSQVRVHVHVHSTNIENILRTYM